MSDPKKLRPDDPIQSISWADFLLTKLLGANRPAEPPGPVAPPQLDLLGRHFGGQMVNNPEEASYYVEQATEPYGKLGRMLTDEERAQILQHLLKMSSYSR